MRDMKVVELKQSSLDLDLKIIERFRQSVVDGDINLFVIYGVGLDNNTVMWKGGTAKNKFEMIGCMLTSILRYRQDDE